MIHISTHRITKGLFKGKSDEGHWSRTFEELSDAPVVSLIG